jgi:hypothetical protein
MLRTRKMEEFGRAIFALSGRIEEKHISELQGLLNAESDPGKVTLDLAEVRLVDCEAVEFLAACEDKGITLQNCPAYIREWITRERGGS